jgi:hypothetical protein
MSSAEDDETRTLDVTEADFLRRLLRNMDSYELLVRSILDLPRKPAILNLK